MFQSKTKDWLGQLNQKLKQEKLRGELCLVGGAVMGFVFSLEPNTKSVSFETLHLSNYLPKQISNDSLREIYKDLNHTFALMHSQFFFYHLSHLNVYKPHPPYLLAIKAKTLQKKNAFEVEQELMFLLRVCNVFEKAQAYEILKQYFPPEDFSPMLDEMLDKSFRVV